ncbi:MAG TPA: FKBP-type peptidyl-prolyl cis-trans isomerase [Planctomycetota bacterium]|nr:FKBP-type peptidyl-prolyl cis-trans isomerase [Planctomycetota bacterium]
MIPRALVCLVPWLTAAALPAQFFLSAETQTRRVTQARWLGLSGEQSVAFEYGQPKWRADYERFVQQASPDRLLLGNGALTTLRTDVDLAFGAQKLARGRWYVGARRNEQQEWSLALFAADKVDATGRGASYLLATEPDLRVPMRMSRENESVELFEITLTDSRRTPHNLALAMAWGPYRMRVDLAASFDDRKPEGAPEFALTAEGKGTKTPSGLIYEQLHAGTGAPPAPTDVLRVHYAGWLTDGTMFDSSHVRGEPATLMSAWVVKGFAEGLQLMQPGATLRLTIPPELAYGARGAGDRVPPNATLVFTVTLVGIDKQ